MAFYAQKNYTDKQGIDGKYTIAQIGCFMTSFCNLLQRFGKNVDPPTLNRIFTQRGIWIDVDDGIRDDLGWPSITAYDGNVTVSEVGGPNTWPTSNNSIVKFYFKSRQTGLMTTHFCLVANASARTIIDSWDGVMKTPGYYGEPVAWASYVNVEPIPVAPLNPAPAAVSNEQSIRYELLDKPRPMHIKKPGGAEKWAFGSVKKWTDFVSTGRFPEHYNTEIVAIAHVPVENDTAAYYMDAKALGDFAITGRPLHAIGFSWADMADGHIDPQAVIPAEPVTPPAGAVEIYIQTGWGISHALKAAGWPEAGYKSPHRYEQVAAMNGSNNWEAFNNSLKTGQKVWVPRYTPPPPFSAIAQQEVQPPAPEPTPAPVVETPPPVVEKQEVRVEPNAYKSTFNKLTPELYVANEDVMVTEFDGRKQPRLLKKNDAIWIDGVFSLDGHNYARPYQAAKLGYWFGIPVGLLTPERELYGTTEDEPIADRTLYERIIVLLGYIKAKYEALINRNGS